MAGQPLENLASCTATPIVQETAIGGEFCISLLESAFPGLIERLKIEEGLQAAEDGHVLSHDEVKVRMAR